MQNRWIYAILLVVVALILIKLSNQTAVIPPPAVVSAPTESPTSAAPARTPVPTPSAVSAPGQGSAPGQASPQPVTPKTSCPPQRQARELTVPRILVAAIAPQGQFMLPELADEICVEPGQTVRLVNEDKIILGAATVVNVEETNSYKEGVAKVSALYVGSPAHIVTLFNFNFPNEQEGKKIVLVTLKIHPGFRLMNFAKRLRQYPQKWIAEVDSAAFRNLKTKGAQIIDVRTEAEFKKNKIPGSVLIPAGSVESGSAYIFPPPIFDLDLVSNQFLVSKVSRDRRPIVVVGQNPVDYRALRALFRLKMESFSDFYWYREGIDGWLAQSSRTPPLHAGVNVVTSAEEARKLLQRGAIFVDARSQGAYRVNTIRGAINLPVRMLTDGRFPAYYAKNLSLETIKKVDGPLDTTVLPTDKTKELVFFALDDFMWQALKGAILARDAGWTRVHWYRGGLEDWMLASVDNPNEFPTVRAVVTSR